MRRKDANFPDNGFEAWGGYMQAKINKLEQQYRSHAQNNQANISNIFSGVSIFVNGYTKPSANELKELMARNGGVYHTYQRSDDFIIASNLPDTKVKNMSLTKVVRPEWITESIASERLLDYRDFLLYNGSRAQLKLNFNKAETSKNSYPMNLKPNKVIPETALTIMETIQIESTCDKSDELIFKDDILKSTVPNNLKQNEHSTKTAADPNFISEFYNNSRLHHISQLGACFKQHINDLRDASDFKFPARTELKNNISNLEKAKNSQSHFEGGKTIMHIDMDCFFVSVGLRKRPELHGKPVAVTHSKGGQPKTKRAGVDRSAEFNLYKQKQAKKLSKAAEVPGDEIDIDIIQTRVDNITDENEKYGSMSEIASCSYEARAKGVSNGMFMGAALKLCPNLQTIPYDFEGYKEVAYTLYNTIAKYTLDIEAVSCDEMYVDCTELLKSIDVTAQDFATALRQEIKLKTGCPCSTGFGGNRLQARLATKHAKPDGQFFLFAELVNDFMFNIKLRDLPGVGRQISQKLEALGHQTCSSLQSLTLNELQRHLGNKTGIQLFDQCRGRDPSPLTFLTVRKSVSAEVNYGIRFETYDQCFDFIKQLSAEVQSRMVQFKVLGKCVTLKLMVRDEEAPVETAKFMGHGFCNVINKSVTLNISTNDSELISKEVISIYKKQKIDPKELRGIGIQITKLEPSTTKPITGALNKFLIASRSNNKPSNIENQAVTSRSSFNTHQEYHPKLETNLEMKEKNLLTPKKLPPYQPPFQNKSPLIGITKSPTGKRRGRPPKNLCIKIKPKNLISKFLQGTKQESAFSFKEETCHQESTVYQVKEENNTKNLQTKKPIIEEPERPGLLGLSWQKVRELLRAWLDSSQAPLSCDIELIATYMREMVISKDIDTLDILLNFLKRRIREIDSDNWTKVYDHIIEQVQSAMVAVYGKKLYIRD